MLIKFLLVGKNKDSFIDNYMNEYQKRIKAFNKFEVTYLKEVKNAENSSQQKKAESMIILNHITKDDFLILLDETGKQLTSQSFAASLNGWQQSGKKALVFLVGGAFGVDKTVFERANYLLSLSSMTFTHQMVRVFFTEQLYRAFTILNKIPYHH